MICLVMPFQEVDNMLRVVRKRLYYLFASATPGSNYRVSESCQDFAVPYNTNRKFMPEA